jgi:YebC/PmpR family DNA-binding regulatory protein
MSGHSKWATIKRKKASIDAKRGKVFTQITKELTIAAKHGGGDPNGNPRLRLAVDKARANNMPAENIKRAIMKGTGELPGVNYEEVTYEVYAPGGVAMLVDTVTDNKNRTVSELRHLLERNNGKLATAGSVGWSFHKRGIIHILKAAYSEDDILNIILDAGADDLKVEDDIYEINTAPDTFENVKKTLEAKNIKIESAELQMIPENLVKVEGKDAEQVLKLVESLEEHDDVQNVFPNFDIDEKIMANFQG